MNRFLDYSFVKTVNSNTIDPAGPNRALSEKGIIDTYDHKSQNNPLTPSQENSMARSTIDADLNKLLEGVTREFGNYRTLRNY